MNDREHKLPLKCRAQVLGISRGTAHYQPRLISEEDKAHPRKTLRERLRVICE